MVCKLKYWFSIESIANFHISNPYIKSFQPSGNDFQQGGMTLIELSNNLSIRFPWIVTK